MPLFRSQVICGTSMSCVDLYSRGAFVADHDVTLGTNNTDSIFLRGAKMDYSNQGATYVDERRLHHLADAYYIMDLANVFDVYETAVSTPSTSFELGHGAGWFGHQIWLMNISATDVSVIMDGSPTWTAAAHTSLLFQHVGANTWTLILRGSNL